MKSTRLKIEAVLPVELVLMKQFMMKALIPLIVITLVLISKPIFSQSQFRITEIITDYNGYWKSGTGAINTVKPDNSHNLLSFSHNGVRYSTGVNDQILMTNGDVFVPGDYRALPVSSLTGVANGNTKIGLGEKYDGVTNGKSNPSPANNIPYYLTDGIKGLDIGTCVANLPAGSLSFAISNIDLAAINDNIPDMVITQTADPSGGLLDRYEFTDINGNRIGNSVDIILSNIPSVGTWVADFYEASANPMTLGTGYTKTERGLRLWTGDFGVFGINASNIGNIAYFKISLSGDSDVGFVAYNNKAFNVDLILPTTLKSFAGKPVSDGIQLNWQTASESNSDKFIVERSLDGFSFTDIGNIQAAGNSNNPRQYGFLAPPNAGTSYYRIRMVDIDSKSKYSSVIKISSTGPGSITVSAYPNPTAGYTYITHPSGSYTGTIRVYNAQGLMLSQVNTTGGKTRIDLANLAKGNYHVRYDNPSYHSTINIIRQ